MWCNVKVRLETACCNFKQRGEVGSLYRKVCLSKEEGREFDMQTHGGKPFQAEKNRTKAENVQGLKGGNQGWSKVNNGRSSRKRLSSCRALWVMIETVALILSEMGTMEKWSRAVMFSGLCFIKITLTSI